ncbi:MAG: prepilin-type N-terminal cleavage/methylation domain-containing protein [Oligoflexia bacterium]|nr:prepilin-type N-terminal cleavage/methylation domain-containing protein [Oligoflexia bacterium]
MMYRHQSRIRATETGFTLVELLVALCISGTVLGLVVAASLNLRDTYYTEIVRTQINSNLRSAMDIMSMSVRQSGENLLSAFPALVLVDGTDGEPDTLTLRRSPITEVLTLCLSASAGATELQISSASLSNAECVPANVGPVYSMFSEELAASGENPRVFIYDSAQHLGEFVDFESGTLASGQYSITTSPLSRAYSQLSTAIYIIEEYRFALSADGDRLELTVDDDVDFIAPVAFDVTNFQVEFDMQDGTVVSSFSQTSLPGQPDWKDVRGITMTLTGIGVYKNRTVNSTISSSYFPRNVLSYEGL